MHSYDDLPQPKKYITDLVSSTVEVITKDQYEDELWQLRVARVRKQNLFIDYFCNHRLTEWGYEDELGDLNQVVMYLEHRLAIYFAQQQRVHKLVKDADELDEVLDELCQIADLNRFKTKKKNM